MSHNKLHAKVGKTFEIGFKMIAIVFGFAKCFTLQVVEKPLSEFTTYHECTNEVLIAVYAIYCCFQEKNVSDGLSSDLTTCLFDCLAS